MLCAVGLAVAGNVAQLIAQAVSPAQFERQLWKQLPIWATLSHNTPSTDVVPVYVDEDGVPLPDDFGRPFFMSPYPDYATEFLHLAAGQCTFSNLGDFDWDNPKDRQCKNAAGLAVPPPTGALLNPVSLAVDTLTLSPGVFEHRVYVADFSNNRIQVYDFDGNSIPVAHPMGSGKFGIGPYSYAPAAGGSNGELLSLPVSVAVDAAHNIIVGDAGNGRIVVFNTDGSKAFAVNLPNGIAGAFKPNQVAITPGSTVIDPASATAASATARILVTDWTHCQVHVFNNKFGLVGSLPSAIPDVTLHDACLSPNLDEGGHVSLPYEISTVTGGTVDASSRIYLNDHAQNSVQVFDKNLVHLGFIGRPGVATGAEVLSGPVGAAFDHLGRLGVNDSGNTRVVFYGLSFTGPGGSPVATYDGQLDTTASHQDFTMGLVEQWGSGNGLDEKGRFLVTDPVQNRVLRFELPELGIVNQQADAGLGSFDVAVPKQKLVAVQGVTTTVQPVESGVIMTGGPTPSAGVDISPAGYQHYTFTYDASGSASQQATFTINASGDSASADEVEAVSHEPCTDCDLDAQVYEDPSPPGGDRLANLISTPNGSWYDHTVLVRLTPTGSQPIRTIYWTFDGVATSSYGSSLYSAPVGAQGSVDVPVLVGGASGLTYFGITDEGSSSEHTRIPLNIDLLPPHVHFLTWTPRTGVVDTAGTEWNNNDVVAGYNVADLEGTGFPGSGTILDSQGNPTIPDGSISFSMEGRGQHQAVHVSDYVSHSDDVDSMTGSGGRPVNIDKTAPTVSAPPANTDPITGAITITITATGQAFGVITAADLAVVSASDPDLGFIDSGVPGSGVLSVATPVGTQYQMGSTSTTITATDYAGNVAPKPLIVTVVQAPSTTTYTGATSVAFGQTVSLEAKVTPTFATGTVTFTYGATAVAGTIGAGGIASATFAAGLLPVGNNNISVSYGGDNAVSSSSTTAMVNVAPATLVTISVNSQSRVYGDPNPTPNITVLGLPVGGILDYTVSFGATQFSDVGHYPITINLGSNPLLTITVVDSTTNPALGLDVTPRPAQVKPSAGLIERVYGDPISFGAADSIVTGAVNGDVLNFSMSAPAIQGSPVGDYSLSIVLGGNPNYDVSTIGGTLRIRRRRATLTAVNASKTFGTADPTLTVNVTDEGILPADPIVVSVSRAAGESATLIYAITPSASGPGIANYQVTIVPAVFTIDKATVAVTPQPASMTYGNAVPALLFDYSTLPGGLTNADINTPPTCTAAGPFTAGGKTITCSGGSDGDVNFTYQTSTLTVNPRSATLTAGSGTKTYGQADPAMTASQSGILSGDVVAIALTTTRTHGPDDENAGTYATGASATGGNSGSYAFSVVAGSLVINKATPTITLAGGPFTYNGATQAATCTVAGVNGQTLTGAVTYSPGPGAPTGAGSYTATCDFAGDGNYNTASRAGTIVINPKGITVTAAPASKLVGAADPPFAYALTAGGPLFGADALTGTPTRVAGETIGTYAILQGSVTAGPNYAITWVSANLTISPANTAPVANPDSATSAGAAPVNINVLANDTDANGDTLSVTAVTQPTTGGVVTRSGNVVVFTPTPGFAGTVTFTYAVSDGHSGTATGTVTVTITPAVCGTFIMTGNTSVSGTAGNLRTFTVSGISVKASAFSRKKTGGTWNTAYLGAFSSGLGVTDGSESGNDNTHKVDNLGDRLNYILFEFSQPVIVTRAYLDAIGADSDATIWFGTRTNPYTNHITLSDAVLTSLGTPVQSTTTNDDARWAAFNASGVAINVIVIAADVTATTPNDAFKVSKLELKCANQPPTVTASNQTNDEGTRVSVQIAGSDPNAGDDITYTASGLPPGLSITATTGLITGTLTYASSGSHTVSVTVTDEAGLTASAMFVWTVNNKNRAPEAQNDTLTTVKNTARTISVIANDTDPDGDTVTLTGVTQPSKGSVQKSANGTIKYTPPSNWTGTTSFTYTVSDGHGGTDTATVTVTVGRHTDGDGCDGDHDHDGDHDRDDDRERDCDRDHKHTKDCDRNSRR